MRLVIILAAIFIVLPRMAAAQDAASFNAQLDIVEDPICFAIENTADYTILGSFTTAEFMRPADGIVASHRSNFRLGAGQQDEFCSYGPFLPGRSLRLTLRTLFPVFECVTRIDSGPIIVKGARNASDSGVDTWAECYTEDGQMTGKPEK